MGKLPHCEDLSIRLAWRYVEVAESGEETAELELLNALSWKARQELAAVNALGFFSYPAARFSSLRDQWVLSRRWPIGWEPQAVRDGLRKLGFDESARGR
jgi:hypothetical protein